MLHGDLDVALAHKLPAGASHESLARLEEGLVAGASEVVIVIKGTLPSCPSYGVTGVFAELFSKVTAGREQGLDVGHSRNYPPDDQIFLPALGFRDLFI